MEAIVDILYIMCKITGVTLSEHRYRTVIPFFSLTEKMVIDCRFQF